MKPKKNNNAPKKPKFKPGSKKRENKCIVTFDDEDRQEYLTGFHKRKVERKKVALAEIKKKIKEEKIRVREQRHKEYIMMLKERREALDEDGDDLEGAITDTTELMQYDHPNHTVTVTTISDLDLTQARLLGLEDEQVDGECEDENKPEGEGKEKREREEKMSAMPKQAHQPILNKKIRSLTSSLNMFTKQKKGNRKQDVRGGRGRPSDKRHNLPQTKAKTGKTGKTSKRDRRRQTGKRVHHDE